jgi:hypothetical protein
MYRRGWIVGVMAVVLASRLARAELRVDLVYENGEHAVLATDPAGNAFGSRLSVHESRLFWSTDGARTWSLRAVHPSVGAFKRMACLRDGVLLAEVKTSAGNVLSRSSDAGATWTDVLELGPYRLLGPRSIEDWNGTVYLTEYQDFADANTPTRLWASTDRGLSWSVRTSSSAHRHGHAVLGDPSTGDLWLMYGDNESQAGLWRSADRGVTWSLMLQGKPGMAADGVFTEAGLIYPQDNTFLPWRPEIALLARDGTKTALAQLPGPGLTMQALKTGGFVVGTWHEPTGDVYPPGPPAAYLYGSSDGLSWKELASYPGIDTTDYTRADANWQLPNGDLVLNLRHVQRFASGRGYQILRPSGATSTTAPPPPSPPPASTFSFADDFEACTSTKDLGPGWDIAGRWYCRVGRARGESALGLATAKTLDAGDTVVDARVVLAGANLSGVAARAAAGAYYAFRLDIAGRAELVRVDASGTVLLARVAAPVVANSGYDLRLEVSGTSPVRLVGSIGGRVVATVDDSSSRALQKGRGGLLNGTAGRTQFDNFRLQGAAPTDVTSPPPPPPPPGATATFVDDFDACSSTTDLGSKWAVFGRWYCSALRARGETENGLALASTPELQRTLVRARVLMTGGSASGVVARARAGAWYAARLQTSGRLEIVRFDASGTLVLGSAPVSISSLVSYVVELRVDGAGPVSLEALLDGRPLVTAEDASGGALASGQAGLVSGSAIRTQFDDVRVEGVTAP